MLNMETNKSQNSTTIKVSELLAPIISSRDVVDVLEDKVKKTDTESVVFDFSNVKFISRSAAHALALLKERFESRVSNKKSLSFVNANSDVVEMLHIVAANKIYPKNKKPEFNPEKIDISSLLKEVAA